MDYDLHSLTQKIPRCNSLKMSNWTVRKFKIRYQICVKMLDAEIPTSEMIKEMWNYGKLGPVSLARLERSVVRQNASNGHPSGDKYLMSYRTVQIFSPTSGASA